MTTLTSVVELHYFYADPAPAPDENFYAASVALAPTLLFSKPSRHKIYL
jgi:hypothetical protein